MGKSPMDYTKEEVARRGDEIYEREIRPKEEAKNRGKVAAIDIESGAYEIGEDELAAADLLRARHPDAPIWFVRIGYPALHRIGARLPSR
jgi:hypothetical protein